MMKSTVESALASAASIVPDLELTVQSDYVHARPRASLRADDVDVACRVHASIDGVLVASAIRKVLFDSRDMRPNPPEVSEVYLRWASLGRYHDRVAILVHSEIRLARSNMNAIARKLGATLRAFHNIGAAVGWLRRQS